MLLFIESYFHLSAGLMLTLPLSLALCLLDDCSPFTVFGREAELILVLVLTLSLGVAFSSCLESARSGASLG